MDDPGGRSGIGPREVDAFMGKSIQVWRLDSGVAGAAQVSRQLNGSRPARLREWANRSPYTPALHCPLPELCLLLFCTCCQLFLPSTYLSNYFCHPVLGTCLTPGESRKIGRNEPASSLLSPGVVSAPVLYMLSAFLAFNLSV